MGRENFKFVVAVYVLFEQNGKILLMRRHNTSYADGWFTLPAGHAEQAEGFVDAAVREAKEETGVDIDPKNMELFHISHHIYNSNERCIDFFFKAKSWTGNISNNEPDKCDLMEWYAKDALPEQLLRNVRIAIEDSDRALLKEFGTEAMNEAMLKNCA